MDEKTLITSTKANRKNLRTVLLILFVLAVLFLIISLCSATSDINTRKTSFIEDHYVYKDKTYVCDHSTHRYDLVFLTSESFFEHFTTAHYNPVPSLSYYVFDREIPLVFIIIHWSLLFVAGTYSLIWSLLSRCKITVTDKNVCGTTAFGKNVVIPLNQISAFGTSKIFSTIKISSSSGSIRFRQVKNYKEVAEVLNKAMSEIQKNDPLKIPVQNVQMPSSANELKEYKDLLDNGIITQEEFDAKKKQLLGL